MSVVTAPTEDECYLLAILTDASGLDIAEFAWFDAESHDGCYRAWDFQWPWYTCMDEKQVDQGGRALGKTVSIQMRACAFPFAFPGQDMLVTAPELNHLSPLTGAIESRVLSSRLLREMLPDTKGHGVTRNPHWQMKFKNNALIVSRLPNKDGKGVKGCISGGTLITTQNGQVPIEDVKVGDEVLTHLGRWQPVDAVYAFKNADGVEVAGGGHRGLVMSERHRMWGRRNSNPQRSRNLGEPEFVNIAHEYPDEIEKRWYMASPTAFPASESPIALSDMWMVGRWVADGHKIRQQTGDVGIQITVSAGQLDGVKVRIDETGRHYHVSKPRAHNGTHLITLWSVELCRLLKDFGELAHGKEIPSWLLGAPEEFRRAFLDGYLSGDGSYDAKKDRWTAGTASKKLAIGLRLLGQSLGYVCGFSWVDPKITHIGDRELKKVPQRCWRTTFTTSNRNAIIEDGHSWQKIRKVTPVENIDVYDLSVREDHSYIADGLVSHNQHVIQIELDEAQDYPLAGWIEIVECLNSGLPGAAWRCHGVPKGIRDRFFEITKPGTEWTVHRPMAFMRPNWNDAEREKRVGIYGGSRQNIDYKRNIYGEHGDASNSVFVLSRLMSCVDQDEASEYNTSVYSAQHILFEQYPAHLLVDTDDPDELEMLKTQREEYLKTRIDLPGSHLNGWKQLVNGKEQGAPRGYSAYYGGMDVGVTNHPSEILIFGQRQGTDQIDLLTRIHLQRINTDDQKAVIEHLFDFYGPKLKAFTLDKTGVGFPIWDQLTRRAIKNRLFGVNFSEKVVIGFEDRDLEKGETQEDLAIVRNVVEATTDWLRNDYVDTKKILLPNDRELLIEFQGQTYTVVKDNGTPYGIRKQFSGGSFHTLDAAKMVMAAKYLPTLEEQLKAMKPQAPVLDQFFDGY